jgi:response regulator RpfG family c-di-GMP phosphodiesterase
MRQLMTRWVQLAGHSASTAGSAEEALDVMERQSPAIALCDIRMPGHDGLWLAERIRRGFPATAVIMATAARDTDPRIAEHTGAVDYLVKPFGRERLKFALERGFDWHHSAANRSEWLARLTAELSERRRNLEHAVTRLGDSGPLHVAVLLDLIDKADSQEMEHARGVAAMAVKIAEVLGLSGDEVNTVRQGALLHDFGKLALPEAILRKPAALSLDEKDLVRQHPDIGAGLLQAVPGLDEAAVIVRSAKEWYDGHGYPLALQGEAIPLGGRIVAVADAFDAMTRMKIYRDALPMSEAVGEILRCAESQFDPIVVAALLKVIGGGSAA